MVKLLAGLGVAVLAGSILAGVNYASSNGTSGAITNTTKTIQLETTPPLAAPTNLVPTVKVTNNSLKQSTLKELDLSGSRQVYIYGVIDEVSAPPVAQQILELGKDSAPINILINSPGGSVLDGASIISAMQAAKGPVNTVCVQICASMAAMIHSYGTKRLMIDRSLVMFHPATGGLEGEVDKMFSRLGTLKDYIAEMELNASSRAGMSYSDYKARSGIEMWLPARKAVATGFADEVVFVRGTAAGKLYGGTSNTMKYINKRLPFFLKGGTTRFMWISTEAFNLLYGEAYTNVNAFEATGR